MRNLSNVVKQSGKVNMLTFKCYAHNEYEYLKTEIVKLLPNNRVYFNLNYGPLETHQKDKQDPKKFIITDNPMIVMHMHPKTTAFAFDEQTGCFSEPYTMDMLSRYMLNGIVTGPLFNFESARFSHFDYTDKNLPDTSPDYLTAKIREEVQRQVFELRRAGKSFLTEKVVEDSVRKAMDKHKQ